MKADYRNYRQAQKESGFGVPVPMPTQSALQVTEVEREAAFEVAWESGSLVNLLTAFTDLATNQEANDTAKNFVHRKIAAIVTDPQVAADLCPAYPVGTKRPCLDTNYYETYNRPNVHLVNLQRTPLARHRRGRRFRWRGPSGGRAGPAGGAAGVRLGSGQPAQEGRRTATRTARRRPRRHRSAYRRADRQNQEPGARDL